MKKFPWFLVASSLAFAATPTLAAECDPVVISTENGQETMALCPDGPPAPAAQVEPAVPLEIAAPIALPTVPEIARPLPPRINTGAIWNAIRELRRSRTELKEVPVKELSTDQLQLIKHLEQIPNLEATLKALPKQGSVATATLPAPQQRAVQEVIATQSQVERSFGRTALDITTVLNALGLLALAAAGWFGYRRLSRRVIQHDERISAVEDRFEVTVTRIKDGHYRTITPAEMRDLKAQESFDYHVLANGEMSSCVGFVQGTTLNGEVLIKHESDNSLVTSRGFHKKVCEILEKSAKADNLRFLMPAEKAA